MSTANEKQIIVFDVNILSPSSTHVSTGKRTIPVAEPMNLEVHTEPVVSVVTFQAYQKLIEHGTPNKKAAMTGLSFHQSLKSCKFN